MSENRTSIGLNLLEYISKYYWVADSEDNDNRKQKKESERKIRIIEEERLGA